jgi:CBS domain-containing protein
MTTAPTATTLLSTLIKKPVIDAAGSAIGELLDVTIALDGADHAPLTGLLVKTGSGAVRIPMSPTDAFEGERIRTGQGAAGSRPFVRADGDVLLCEDVLEHRLVDIDRARLVQAHDAALTATPTGWVVSGLDVHKRRRFPLGHRHEHHPMRDWAGFEALLGHEASASTRSIVGRLRRLRPAQLADLIEEASDAEKAELLGYLHADPELEADVFEELDEHQQTQLLRTRPVAAIADVLARMRADDAADAIIDLPQEQRLPVLELLPDPHRTKVRTLLGYHDATAGGLMGVDYLALPETDTIAAALDRIREARTAQPEALSTIYATTVDGRLRGALGLVRALQLNPATTLGEAAEGDPVRARPGEDLIEVAKRMADYNLLTLPVVDPDDRILGVITVDDVLEAAIPSDWLRRE